MIRFLLVGFFIVVIALPGWSQIDGDYRTVSSGDWNSVTTWQVYNASAWHNLSDAGAGNYQNVIPSDISGTITILGTNSILTAHVVNIPLGQTISANDLVVEDADATINVFGRLIIIDGPQTDDVIVGEGFGTNGIINVMSGGVLENQGAISAPGSGFNIGSSATYLHNQNGGNIPSGTWATGSFCEIQGVINSMPTGLNQTFHHLTYNSSTQTSNPLSMVGITEVKGDLSISNSNNRLVVLFNSASPNVGLLKVGGNFIIGSTGAVGINSNSGSFTLSITGNLISSSSANPAFLGAATGSAVVNVSGGVTISGSGAFRFVQGSSSVASCTLNVTGDFNFTSGIITEANSSTGYGSINFENPSQKNFVGGGSFSNSINFNVASGATLNLGTSYLAGAGTLTVSGTLQLGSIDAAGAYQSSRVGGNLRNTGTHTFIAGSTIVYNGEATQYLGDGLPSSANLTINNSNNVYLSGETTIPTNTVLTLTLGKLIIGSNTLTVNGAISVGSGFLSASNTSNLIINGTGALGTIPFDAGTTQIYNFTLNRTGANASATLGTDLDIIGALDLENGDFIINNRALTLSGTIDNSIGANDGLLAGNTSTILNIQGSGAYGEINFQSASLANSIKTINLDRSLGSLTIGNAVIINDALNLATGALTIGQSLTMASGTTINRRGGGSIAGVVAPIAITRYNVSYLGSTAIVAGLEMPTTASGDLNNLTINNSNTVTLSSAIAVNGNLTIGLGSELITSAPNGISLAGDFANSGTFTPNNSTFTLSGSSPQLISGTTDLTFYNLTSSTSAVKTLGVNVIVSNMLTLNGGGAIDANGNYIYVVNTASTSVSYSGNSRVIGELRREVNISTNYTFPTGSETALQRVDVNFSDLGGLTYASFGFSSTSPGDDVEAAPEGAATFDNMVAEGFWIIDGNYTSTPVYSLRLFPSFIPDGINEAFTIFKRSGGSRWAASGDPNNPSLGDEGSVTHDGVWADGSIRRSNMSGFSNVGVAGSREALPVELLHFNASKVNSYVQLNWATLTETKSSHFIIERSESADKFKSIGRVESAGNSSMRIDYEFKDLNASNTKAKILYYRLRQVDVDGQYKIYPIKAVNINEIVRGDKIRIHPNPASTKTNITSYFEIPVTLKVYSALGKKIHEEVIDKETTSLNTSFLRKGIYIFKFESGFSIINKKVIIE